MIFYLFLWPKVMPIACPHGIGVQITNYATKAFSRPVDRAILVSEIGENLKIVLVIFLLKLFFDNRCFFYLMNLYILSYMTNPILMNIYRGITDQKLMFSTFSQIFYIKPDFCKQNLFIFKR